MRPTWAEPIGYKAHSLRSQGFVRQAAACSGKWEEFESRPTNCTTFLRQRVW